MKKLLSVLMITMIIFAGCSQSDSTNEEKKITVVLDWIPNVNHTGLYVAKVKNYYKNVGLDVEILSPPEDGALALLASGKADFAVSFQEEIAMALTADTPLDVIAVAAIIQHNTSGVLSLKNKQITRPKEMENHNYATWGSPIEKAILKQIISNDGGNFAKVNIIPSTVTDAVTALSTNIDTVWGYYAVEVVAAKTKGLDTNFFYIRDNEPSLDFYTPLLVSSSRFLKENPESAKKFLSATTKGYEFAIKSPEASAGILCKVIPELDEKIVVAGQNYLANEYKADADKWGKIEQTRWDNFYTWLFESGVLHKKIKSGVGFTNEYLED